MRPYVRLLRAVLGLTTAFLLALSGGVAAVRPLPAQGPPLPLPLTSPTAPMRQTFINDTGTAADGLHLAVDLLPGRSLAWVDLFANATGCLPPRIAWEAGSHLVDVIWPAACVAPGASVVLGFPVAVALGETHATAFVWSRARVALSPATFPQTVVNDTGQPMDALHLAPGSAPATLLLVTNAPNCTLPRVTAPRFASLDHDGVPKDVVSRFPFDLLWPEACVAPGDRVTIWLWRDGHSPVPALRPRWSRHGLLAPGAGVDDASDKLPDDELPLWQPTGDMTTPRIGHTATLLPTGRVLVIGGYDSVRDPARGLASAELYDPRTSTWTATGYLAEWWGRPPHTAVLLTDGRVLVVWHDGVIQTPRPEIYDPATNTWILTGPRDNVRGVVLPVVPLPDGRALAAGMGIEQLYDPATNAWRLPGGAHITRAFWRWLVLLANDTALMIGTSGNAARVAELYTPGTDAWTEAGRPATIEGVSIAAPLADGTLLLAGDTPSTHRPLVQRYHPTTTSWVPTAGPLTLQSISSLTVLPGGGVLALGYANEQLTAERYDADRDTWTAAGSPRAVRIVTNSVLRADGAVLVVGDGYGLPLVAEVYDPNSNRWIDPSRARVDRIGYTLTSLPDGTVMVAGGFGPGPDATAGERLRVAQVASGSAPPPAFAPPGALLASAELIQPTDQR